MVNSLRLALSFLTILPLYHNKEVDNQELARSVSYYTLVGLALGIISGGICLGLHSIGLTLSADVMAIIALVVLTGGLHLDGLMDTADGLFSGRSRERKLEIMKDSRVGAMGVIAFGTVILLKIAFLSEINGELKYTALLLAPAAGRWAMVYGITCYPYARTSGGLGACLESAGKKQMAIASITLIIATLGLVGATGVVLLGAVFLAAWTISKYITKCLGGMTGDTYGATGELIETWTLLSMLMAQQFGLI